MSNDYPMYVTDRQKNRQRATLNACFLQHTSMRDVLPANSCRRTWFFVLRRWPFPPVDPSWS